MRRFLNWAAVSTVVSDWFGWMPPLVAFLATVASLWWFGLQIYDRLKYGPRRG
jgi:hypothetical protein